MKALWPQDYRDAAFLGRAADEVGTAMFGPEWTGKEFQVRLLAPLRVPTGGAASMSTLEMHRAHVLLHVHRPDRGLPPPPSAPLTRAPVPPVSLASWRPGDRSLRGQDSAEGPATGFTPTDEDVAEANHVIAELNEENAAALARRSAVSEEIVRGCEAGDLSAYYLDAATGRLCPTPSEWWRSKNVQDRFEQWQMDFKNPLKKLYYTSESVSWLYVSRDSLAAFIRAKPFNKRVMAELQHGVEAEALADRLREEAQWELPETLLWIGLRDLREASRQLAYWRDFPEKGSGFTIAMTHTYLAEHAKGGEAVRTVRPDELLMSTLRRGEVTATGLFRGTESRRAIPAVDWYDLTLIDGPEALTKGDASAFGPGLIHGANQTAVPFWTRLLFSRAEVVRIYPAEPQAPSEVTKPTASLEETASWRVRPGELQKAWVFRADVVAEAERRRKRQSEAALCDALAEMARESGCTWTAAAIGATRRKAA